MLNHGDVRSIYRSMVKRDTKSNQKAPIPKRRRDNHAPPSETEPLEWPSKPEQRSVRPRGDAALPRASAPVRTISHGTSHGASRYGVDDRVEKGFSSSECVPSDKNQATSSSDEDLDGLQERIKSAPTHGETIKQRK